MMEAAEYNPISGNLLTSTNYQEYFLQGSILDAEIQKLLDRLQGLCDNVSREQFTDQEKTFVLRAPNAQPVMVKSCKALSKRVDWPWQIKYIGTTETGDRAKSSLIRSCVTVASSKDPSRFLDDLGFKLQNELVTKGFFFRKGRVKITVTKLHKHMPTQEPSKVDPISQSHLVEVSVFAPASQEKAGDEVRQFCEQLKPLVAFDVDHRKLQQLTNM